MTHLHNSYHPSDLEYTGCNKRVSFLYELARKISFIRQNGPYIFQQDNLATFFLNSRIKIHVYCVLKINKYVFDDMLILNLYDFIFLVL